MFEYQTAISELTGLPVSNASRLRGAERGRRRRLPGQAPPAAAHALPRLAAACTRTARETLATTSVGWGTTIEEIPLARRRHGRRRAARRRSATTSPRSSSRSRTSSARSRTSRRSSPAAKEAGALVDRAVRPADARRPAPAGRLRRRHRGRGGPDARQPARLRRPELRLLRRPGGATCGGCRAGSPARRPTSTAAAASCSRCRRASSTSGARRRRTTSAPRRRSTRSPGMIYLSWLGRAGLVELGELLLQRTAYARERAGRARRRRARCTSSRSCASSPCALDAPRRRA